MNTYTKLRDGWGVRATTPALPGATVLVTKKSGETKTETVARVLGQGPDKRTGEQVYLLAIRQHGQSQSRGGLHRGEVRCNKCGQWTPEGDDWCVACGAAGYEM